eukprot:766462-Hanusia_phi.AAC.2
MVGGGGSRGGREEGEEPGTGRLRRLVRRRKQACCDVKVQLENPVLRRSCLTFANESSDQPGREELDRRSERVHRCKSLER